VDCHADDMKQVIRLEQRDKENTDRLSLDHSLLNLNHFQPKNHLMESLYKLKNADDHFCQLSVTHIMTKTKELKFRKIGAKLKER